MQCSVRKESGHYSGNNKMKTVHKNKKDPKLDNICEQVAGVQDTRRGALVGMPIEQAEAVRRYYAAFPALRKGAESPLQYYLPPPAWCRRAAPAMEARGKRAPRERRNSYHAPKKNNKKRCALSRSLGSDTLPEWVTHEAAWDMEAQDPVRDFIRALALDEGYGTCENTLADEPSDGKRARREPAQEAWPVPEPAWPALEAAWPDLEPAWAALEPAEPLDVELYARFEAKFDRSLEALWEREQDTPDDEYQELPIDLASLLASPSDRCWEARASPALHDAVWAPASPALHDRLRPLHLASPAPPPPPPAPPELESFALYDGDALYDALATVADTLRSLTAINHSRDTSGFAEVPPRRRAPPPAAPARAPPPPPGAPREDLLRSARTHFRPIRRDSEGEARYADGDTFDVCAELEPVAFGRSPSGGAYLGAVRYLEYRAEERERGIDYGRLALTAAQRAEAGAAALPLRFAVRQLDAGSQTDVGCAPAPPPPARPPPDELSRDWEELLADISAAHAAGAPEPPEPAPDRKRRHSAALRCARACTHPHARFLPCCALHRPLTR